ncbi:MAG: DUF5011 domain-containing protein, partial [Euryarchaeota archaeon]|nr:DUF5011 domain-containing protein [Euryarchaeota archaeon]
QGTGLDPRPANNGPAYANLAPLPRGDLFYKLVDHKGAFGDEDWTAGWSKIGTEYTGDIFQEIDLPEVTIEGDEKIVLFVGESYNEGGATAVDGAGQNIGNVTTSGSVDTNTPGVYQITYTAEDGQGNTRTAVREVTVLEKTLTGDLNAGISQVGSIEIDAGSEILAFHPDSNTVFVVAGDIVEAIDITDPSAPVAIDTLELDADAQSVAINGNLMALAVAAPTGKQDNGSVLFYKLGVNGKPTFAGEIIVGPLPDSLAFSPDGSVLVVANEGEPNDFYDVDPEGSISVIKVFKNNPAASPIATVDFTDWNGRAGELKAKGIRISGTGTVAQDIEPEYVTISKDGMVAYVTLQENNAVAKVDISDPMNPSLMAIYSAGIKDWERGLAKATNVEFTIDYPSSTPRPDANGNGQVDPGEVTAGGLSGLWYAGKNGSNEDVFYTISDRGPQAFDIGDIAGDDPSDPNHGEKIFDDPDFPSTIYE